MPNPLSITIKGETKTLAEWSKLSGLKRHVIAYRFREGWPEDQILIPKTPHSSPDYYIGRRYDMLVVVECIEPYNGRNRGGVWKCLCDCGEYAVKHGIDLHRAGRFSSCGCANNENPIKYKFAIGEKVGRYTILGESTQPRSGTHGGAWMVRCDCGKEMVKSGLSISKNTWHKGCAIPHPNTGKQGHSSRHPHFNHPPAKRRMATINEQYVRHKNRCKKMRCAPLSRQEWESIVFLPCAFCGDTDIRSVSWSDIGRSGEIAAMYRVAMNGVDRVDSSKPYAMDNSIPCCGLCNWLKNNTEINLFLSKIKQIYEHRHLIQPAHPTPRF